MEASDPILSRLQSSPVPTPTDLLVAACDGGGLVGHCHPCTSSGYLPWQLWPAEQQCDFCAIVLGILCPFGSKLVRKWHPWHFEMALLSKQRRRDHGVGRQPCPTHRLNLFRRLQREGEKRKKPALFPQVNLYKNWRVPSPLNKRNEK